jgi:hypothetical protein
MTTLSEHLSRLGKKGGAARAKKLTSEERSDSARKAVEARWAKRRKLVEEITEGSKQLLDITVKREKAMLRKQKQRKAKQT